MPVPFSLHLEFERALYAAASHLMLASILIAGGGRENYVGQVMEAFLLPPPAEAVDSAAEIDDELLPDTSVNGYGEVRLAVYRRIGSDQRACVGRFLDLYLRHRGVKEFTQQGLRLFELNRDYWLHSSR